MLINFLFFYFTIKVVITIIFPFNVLRLNAIINGNGQKIQSSNSIFDEINDIKTLRNYCRLLCYIFMRFSHNSLHRTHCTYRIVALQQTILVSQLIFCYFTQYDNHSVQYGIFLFDHILYLCFFFVFFFHFYFSTYSAT